MTTVLPFSNNSITVYKYEPFSYTISNSNYPTINPTVVVSPGIPPSLVANNDSNVVFSAAGYNGGTSSNESIVIDISTAISSNSVSINPGRFRDSNSNSFSNTAFTFYKNEAITPVTLNASISLLSPLLSFPALPAGLTLTKSASNQFTLSGTPVTQTPTSNYQIIGQGSNGDAGKIVTTISSIAINGERLRLAVQGTPTVSGMVVDTPITQRIVTASFPLASGPNLRYTWDPLPSGIYFGDLAGTSQASGFQPLDASYTLTLQGTPTVVAAKSFAIAGITSYTANVQALRLTSPTISNTTFFTFQFVPTVLFDDVTIPTFYTDISLNPTQTSFFAKTYFGTDASISTIFSPDLRSDLSLNFVSNQARAYLTGTPLTSGTNTYTIRASNTLGVSRDLAATIAVSNTSIAFDTEITPAVDTCYNYILSRPSSNAKTGYYPASVQFKVTTLPTTLPITLTTSDLVGTGLSLTVSGNTGQITGVPDTITALKTVTVTAASASTSASASTRVKLAILNDSITFASVSSNLFDFVQNRQITPIQVQATAVLSERPITSYSATGLPIGLGISSGGQITGTPLSDVSGTATITATTGFAVGSTTHDFTMKPDSILFRTGIDPNARTYIAASNAYTYQAGDPITIPIQGQTYSGQSISTYDISSTRTFGLTIASNGLLSGPWMSGIPPTSALYPASCNFFLNATGGLFSASLPTTLTVAPIVSNVSIMIAYYTGSLPYPNYYWSYDPTATSNEIQLIDPFPLPNSGYTIDAMSPGLRFKTTTTVPNQFVGAINQNYVAIGTRLVTDEFSNASNFQYIDIGTSRGLDGLGAVEHKPGTSTWWITGFRDVNKPAVLFTSRDDGQTWDASGVDIATGPYAYLRPRMYAVNGVINRSGPYLYGGMALRYDASSGVLFAGGVGDVDSGEASMLRSTDEGSTWEFPDRSFFGRSGEVGDFCFDNPSVWIAAGSERYQTASIAVIQPGEFNVSTTLKYSTNQGETWENAGGDFNMFAYDVTYGSNVWLATGVSASENEESYTYTPELRTSTDGMSWEVVDLSTNDLGLSVIDSAPGAPLRISKPMFDGSRWTVFVVTAAPPGSLLRFQHDTTSPLTSGWSQKTMTVSDPAHLEDLRLTSITPPGYLYQDDPPINLGLTFTTVSGTGPTVTSTSTEFRLNQFIAIDPIQLTATGTGDIYFFILNSELPQGLTFNPATNTISGTPVKLGPIRTPVFVRDDSGVTQFTLAFETLLPTVQKVQTSAAAFTSLLRQYTIVNAAQNARDNRVFPAVDRLLGEFTSPYPPDVITQTIDPRCRNPNCD